MLIYLNGTSSSGKTSVANELQKLIQKPIFYFSIDTLLYSLSQEDLNAIMGKQPSRTPLNWEAIFSGYFSCITALTHTGNSVIADCPVYQQGLFNIFEKYISSVAQKTIIKITCPLEIIKIREVDRKDRAIGVAEKQFEEIHKYLNYDLEVDSVKLSPFESAQKIFDFLKK